MGKSTTSAVKIGDGKAWHCTPTAWQDGDDGGLTIADGKFLHEGPAMQALHFAFNRELCYSDCTVRFKFALQGHTDLGVILRARDESHFYLLHFPNCGQASRAQHFWVVLSKMDDSGWLRNIKMEMVRRVPSTKGILMDAQITVRGGRIMVNVGDYGRFEAEDDTYQGPGHIGIFQGCRGEAGFGIGDVEVEGVPAAQTVWRDPPAGKQPVNWRHPLQAEQREWHQPIDLKRFDDGELLLLVNIQRTITSGDDARAVPHLIRSKDNGQTWTKPVEFTIGEAKSSWSPPRIHITPGGRLIGMIAGTDHKIVSESTDRGETWQQAGKANLHLGPPREQPVQDVSPQGFLNLADGGMLAFMLGGVKCDDFADYQMFTWGSAHCQAFCSRSDDDGKTWTTPVSVDTPGVDNDGKPLAGSLDLTEMSAAQLGSGRVMGFIRPCYSPWMWETWSDDGGRTWGPCVRGPFPGYAAPNMVRTASGALLLAHRLPWLTVHCSLDDGQTWDQGTTIDSGTWAMGTMCQIEPDLVLYLYWDSFESLMRAQYLRVTAGGLEPVRK